MLSLNNTTNGYVSLTPDILANQQLKLTIMTDTFRQFELRGNLERMVNHRMTEQELNEILSHYFRKEIKVEQGQYDDDWQGDDYYTFCVDDNEIGGYFDIYYINMPNKKGFFYITEVNIYFE